MTTPAQHTAGALKAAEVINRHLSIWNITFAPKRLAGIIEHHTGLPDLLEACKAVCAALGDISNGQHERGLPTEDVNKISRAFFQAQRALARAEQSSPREGKE